MAWLLPTLLYFMHQMYQKRDASKMVSEKKITFLKFKFLNKVRYAVIFSDHSVSVCTHIDEKYTAMKRGWKEEKTWIARSAASSFIEKNYRN